MAEEQESAGDKTEAPTQRRLEKAREQGQVAVSREVTGAVGLAGALAGLAFALPLAAGQLVQGGLVLFERSSEITGAGLAAALWRMLLWGALAVAAVALPPMLLGPAATLLQTRGMVSSSLIVPKASRLSPLGGLKRLVSAANLVEFLKNLAKLAVLCAVAGLVLGAMAWQIVPAVAWPTGRLAALRDDSLVLLGALAGAFAAIAVLDLLWVRYDHVRRLRMSREDIREELKETEGDPEIRARLKRI